MPVLSAESQAKPATAAPSLLSPEDDAFLDELEKLGFQYFWDEAGEATGLVRDRCNVVKNDNSVVASIAATGFGLTALCIAHQRGFISFEDARDRALLTLRFLWKKMPTHRGFFYHFADINTGERVWDSEVSSVDTSILLCGILTCRRHFEEHSEVSLLAYEIFNRVDWSWLSEDTSLLPHGWTPEFGFLPYRWDYYSEMMMIYLLGLDRFLIPSRHRRGTHGNAPSLSTMVFATSAPLRRYSFTSTRRPGSTSGINAISMRTTSRTRFSPRTRIVISAWSWARNFPITATISGGFQLRIRRTAM